jgi:hypothetical protein
MSEWMDSRITGAVYLNCLTTTEVEGSIDMGCGRGRGQHVYRDTPPRSKTENEGYTLCTCRNKCGSIVDFICNIQNSCNRIELREK